MNVLFLSTATSMAVVVVRCSCLLTHSSNSRRPPQSDQLFIKSSLPGRLSSLSFKMEKLVSSLGDTITGPTESHSISLGSNCQGNLQISFPTAAFVVSNVAMFATPFKALAETCETDNSLLNMPLLLFVSFVGATVGGLLARQRRGELQRLNEQLRQINAALRRQAKVESYAPSLSYAPIGGRVLESEVIVDPKKQDLISRLKTGKNLLRNQELEKAFLEFKMALELAQSLKDHIKEKKAARGLGACLQRQGKYQDAIKYHSIVLAISDREGEDSGNTEAYGAIADCYTELGDLERAGNFYDKYISRLEKD